MAKAATTNISIRMDADLKSAAEELFADLGMNISTAFNIFVRQSLREGRIPFIISQEKPNHATKLALSESEKLLHDDNAKSYHDVDAMFEDILDD